MPVALSLLPLPSRLTSRAIRLLASLLATCPGTGLGQATAGLDPPAPAERRFALERYFYATPAATVAEGRRIDLMLHRLAEGCAAVGRSPAALERAFALDDSIDQAATRLGNYHRLLAAIDTRDLPSARTEDSLWTAVETGRRCFEAALEGLAPTQQRRLLAGRPGLGRYRFALARAHREPRRQQPDAEAALLARLGALATGWQFPLWQRLDRDAREARALVLGETVRSRNALARERGFGSAPEEAYASRGLTVDSVRVLYRRVRASAGRFREYLALRAAALPVSTPYAAPLDSVAPWTLRALAPLGPTYQRELAALFDPANGRLDIGGGGNRRAGGFSFLAPGAASGVYLDAYGGRLRDLSRLTHESGHAIHRRLMDLAGVPAPYRSAPLLMEPIALFNELAVADHRYREAVTPGDRRQTLELFLNKAFEVYFGARDAELEQAFYDRTSDGGVVSAEALDSLTREVDQGYAPSGTAVDGRRWMQVDLPIEDPLYLVNYLYSGLIALALFDAFERDRAGFGLRYERFLEAGFDDPPLDLVRRRLGIALDRDLLASGMALLDWRVNAYRVLAAP